MRAREMKMRELDETRELDEIFLQECLSELRDGETVTIDVGRRNRERVRDKLIELGATWNELDNLVIV
jgi:hypothetical protein